MRQGDLPKWLMIMSNTQDPSLALIVFEKDEKIHLLEALSQEEEISVLKEAISHGVEAPLTCVYEYRVRTEREDEEFGDFVEGLISQPFVHPEVQKHAVQWLKSKIKIEGFKREEISASTTISKYALQVFEKDRTKTDFFLSGPAARVRVQIFVLHGKTDFAA